MKPPIPNDSFKKNIIKKQLREKQMDAESKKIIALHVFWVVIAVFFVFVWAIYLAYLQDLPSIKKLWEDILPESTVIYDRNWNELYNLYSKEKRTYVQYSTISQHMKDAIISTEDKTFFENSWFDFKWLVRAWTNYMLWKSDKIQWTSTISQQLIKNSFLTPERSIKRKIQELYLSYQLNVNYSKEKILELYLNKISFWSNSFWIEEASKTFFWKSSKDLGILESSILASIPKWPTYYSPYTHKDRLMWNTYTYKKDTPKNIINVEETENPAFYAPLSNKLKAIITDLDIKDASDSKYKVCNLEEKFFKPAQWVDKSWCSTFDKSNLIGLLNNIVIPYDDLSIENKNPDLSWYILEYNAWRKDLVLWRMLEDWKINAEDYKKAIVDGFDFKFKRYSEKIKYPYFVFYVKEYLENKYWKDFWSQGWLKIYTTIDPKLQDKAEELVKKQVEKNTKVYWATNAALISLDNRNWNILAMVWWADYFGDSKASNVNVVTSERQPWSSFKPLVYAYAISKKPIWPDTPVYDSETKFSKWEPDNYDQKFMWMMSLKKALWYSRNIPAIKVFMYWGWENEIIKFANSLWIASLRIWANYGWPLAIWTWELKPLELAQAYSVFANMWIKREATPILRIEDKKWNLIEDSRSNTETKIFSPAASYVITKMLSDPANRPNSFWNNVLTLKDRKVAAKTWTSNKDVSEWWKKKILPWDLWTAWYTPQITTVVWAWNSDGSPTKWTCDWLNCAAPIWHDYMEFAHKWLEKAEFKEPDWVIKATISKASWKLTSNTTPDSLKVSSIFAVKPFEYDGWYKQMEVDSLCNWKVTDNTPPEAIKTIYLWWSQSPIIDSYDKDWLKSIGKYSIGQDNDSWTLAASISSEPCERPSQDTSSMSVSSNIVSWRQLPTGASKIEIRFDSNNPVAKVVVLRDSEIVKSFPIADQYSWNISDSIDFGSKTGTSKIIIKVVDKYYYTKLVTYEITFAWDAWAVSDTTSTGTSASGTYEAQPQTTTEQPVTEASPAITITNPTSWSIKIFQDQYANIRWTASGPSEIVAINVYLNWKLFKILEWGSSFVFWLNETKEMEPWTYSIKIEAVDASSKTWFKIIEAQIMAR